VAQQPSKYKLTAGARNWRLPSRAKIAGGSSTGRLGFLSHIIGKRVERSTVQWSIAVLALVLIAIVSSRLHLNLAAVGLLFVIVIVLLARVADFFSSVVVSIIALWFVYIAPPDYSFPIHDPLDVVAIVSFWVVSLMIAWMVSKLREMSEEALLNVNRKLIDAEERVRVRIGKQLHDDIEQRLALLAVQAAQGSPDPSGPADDGLSSMHRIQEQAARIAADVQSLAYELHPYKLEYLGLAPVMKSFCERLGKQHDLKIDFKCHHVPNDLPLNTSVSLSGVLEEALHNSLQHGRAHHIGVELFALSEGIHLIIRDSGVGFNPQAAMKGPGLGLVSMKERLKLVCGEFSIRSQPGKGCTVHACVPLMARPTRSFQAALRLSLPVAVTAGAAILLAIAIQVTQGHHPASSNVDWASSMPKEGRKRLASNHAPVHVSRKRSKHQKKDAMAPGPAFRRVQFGPNEVDYVAEDVTVRHFTTHPTRTQAGSRRKRANVGKDLTVRYFSKKSTFVSQAAVGSSAIPTSK
jgi:signal transduction histidine kinase